MSPNTGAKIKILAPTPNQVITGNVVDTRVLINHFKIDCNYAGTAPRMGMGHYHIHLDGALINMFCESNASVSLANVKPGRHTLEFIAAENNHMEDMHSAKSVTFIYKPKHPLTIAPRHFAAQPSITIVSPKNGATVSGGFNLVVSVKNFIPSCALYGKPDIAGYGHWHAFVDTTNGGAMGMGTMLGMSCARSFHVSLAGIKPGAHKFFAVLEDDAHAPTIAGKSTAQVSITVK
ncbi:MAG: hypothetical protein KGL15_04835 [Acidobacteriota bacterium]|nr:hypothetical protein [Acidobacteriota bacterium]